MKAVAPEQNDGVSVKTNGPWSRHDVSLAQVSHHRAWDKEPANAGGTGQNDGGGVKMEGPWSRQQLYKQAVCSKIGKNIFFTCAFRHQTMGVERCYGL